MDEWNENRSLEWELLQYPVHKEMQEYVKALNHLYTTQPALYEMDYEPEGFEWINCTYNDENIAIFIRKTKRPEDTLLFVCNFVPVSYTHLDVYKRQLQWRSAPDRIPDRWNPDGLPGGCRR